MKQLRSDFYYAKLVGEKQLIWEGYKDEDRNKKNL